MAHDDTTSIWLILLLILLVFLVFLPNWGYKK
ncbi:hypothetical protein EDD75_1542 [Thermodesulfitimonas autotrophica]|jgi:hypothetical protein|uniref:Uncharacterized protein n=1 Tax=Thermodesulfitimonas autotrophica TaxID=1894989 RepID=A0A3N5BEH3_9THEO|nr:hypothetical protein EDD75_1542 [Thermodesulfitimonas autotrophica]